MDECQEALVTFKGWCISAPILAFADFTKPFKLHTNASTLGQGAVLYQEQDGKDRVIMYTSRALSKSESCYPANKLENLSFKVGCHRKFSKVSIW